MEVETGKEVLATAINIKVSIITIKNKVMEYLLGLTGIFTKEIMWQI